MGNTGGETRPAGGVASAWRRAASSLSRKGANMETVVSPGARTGSLSAIAASMSVFSSSTLDAGRPRRARFLEISLLISPRDWTRAHSRAMCSTPW